MENSLEQLALSMCNLQNTTTFLKSEFQQRRQEMQELRERISKLETAVASTMVSISTLRHESTLVRMDTSNFPELAQTREVLELDAAQDRVCSVAPLARRVEKELLHKLNCAAKEVGVTY
jgi:hypothetical protein